MTEGGRRLRAAVLAVYHETNTFSPLRTDADQFAQRWHVGDDLVREFDGTRTMVGGFIDGIRAAGLELVPILATYATPSGTVTRAAFDAIADAVREGLVAAGPIDGVLFEVHGDLMVEGMDDPEETLVGLVRELAPGAPIGTALDLHANMSRPRFTDVEIVIGYRTNPHVDTYERGVETVELLAPLLRGAPTPVRAHRGLAVVAAPSAQLTAEEPLRSLLARADELRSELGLLNVTVHAGYAYADAPYTGMGFEATADPDRASAAEVAVEALLALATATAGRFATDFAAPEHAVVDALSGPAPVIIADTGDNINGGAPGDTTWLVHEALRHPEARFLCTLADPEALRAFRDAGVGARVRVPLGGRASERSGAPIDVDAQVIAIGDGRFRNTGPMATGALVDLGGAAWVRAGNVDVLVQGVPRQPNDPNMFHSIGISVGDYDVVLLKGAAALRAGWSSLAGRFVDAATRGETDSDVARLRFVRASVVS